MHEPVPVQHRDRGVHVHQVRRGHCLPGGEQVLECVALEGPHDDHARVRAREEHAVHERRRERPGGRPWSGALVLVLVLVCVLAA